MGNINRREFLRSAGIGVASAATGLALVGCTSTDQQSDSTSVIEDIEYSSEADVVIVGGGGAGLMAAVGAHEQGVGSLIIEQNGVTGGDTALSNQVILGFWPEQQEALGVMDDSAESYLTDWRKSHEYSMKGISGSELSDTPFCQRLCEEGHIAWQWIAENANIEWAPSYSISVMMPAPSWDTNGPRRWKAKAPICSGLTKAVEKFEDCTIMYNTWVSKLLQDAEGKITGVCIRNEDGTFSNIKANNGVVITTGSFIGNSSYVSEYIGFDYGRCATGGRPGNRGDGMRMAQEVGAATVDLKLGSHTFASSMGTYDVWPVHDHMGRYGEFEKALGLTDPAVYINTEGKRFAPESLGYSWAGKHIVEQPNHMAYYMFDSTQPDDELVAYDNMILMQDETLEGLAKSMNVPRDAFLAEIERYNGFVETGVDEDYGKYMNTATKIEVGPFFAIPVVTMPYANYGGLKIDIDTHVIDINGKGIPGLYAAGTVTGIYAEQEGLFYCGGVQQALYYGMVAGINAAQMTEASSSSQETPTTKVTNSFVAGTYTGEGPGMHGTIKVTLTVDSTSIVSIDEISDPGETEGVGGKEAIADGTFASQLLSAQSANIDGISGATVTTNGVIKAAQDALAQAQN